MLQIFSRRAIFFWFFAIVVTIAVSVSVASRIHNDIEGLLSRQLQSNLISIDTDYRKALLDVQEFSVLFVGDIMLSRDVGKVMFSREDYKYPFLYVADVLSGADIAFGNLEGPISSRGSNVGSIYSFRADPRSVEGLTHSGFDVLSLANNHIFDWGRDALDDTVSLLFANGITPVGAGRSYEEANTAVVKSLGTNTIGFLSYTTLYPDSLKAREDRSGVSDLESAGEAVRLLSGIVDIVVVSIHWGEEYETESNKPQQDLAHKLIDAGADIVVGHHPHVRQEIERYNDGWIIYSLGNFVFDQNFSEEPRTGLVAEAVIENGKVSQVKTMQIYISETFQPAFVGL